MMASLSSIHQYPVKSFGGNCISQADIQPEGMAGDRRWLITDLDGRLITARRYPQMLLWQASIDAQQNLTLTSPNGDSQLVDKQTCSHNREVAVFQDTFMAHRAPNDINQWISAHLNTPCLLHYLGDTSQRPFDGPANALTFADGAPYLLTTKPSLTELNQHLDNPVTMTHFRPNFVVEGDFEPWLEEEWRGIRIGDVQFEFYQLCARCVMININPESAQKSPVHQPYKTLQRLQKERPNGSGDTIFGIYLTARNSGIIQQGSTVEIF